MAKNWVPPEMVQKAMRVDLLQYVQQTQGWEFETRGNPDVFYKTTEPRSFNISRTKNLYHRFSTHEGGNPINFVQEYEGLSFQDAVRKLCGEDIQSGYKITEEDFKARQAAAAAPKGQMVMPNPAENCRRAFAYLVKSRKIDSEIVSDLMKEKKIYESHEKFAQIKNNGKTVSAKLINYSDFETMQHNGLIRKEKTFQNGLKVGYNSKGDIKYIGIETVDDAHIDPFLKSMHFLKISPVNNCVFVGYKENGEPGYASARSINTFGNTHKGDIPNSDKQYGFTIGGKSDTVYVFEAPIDAMSYATIVKMYGTDWKNFWYTSLGGIADLGLQHFLEQHPEVKSITFCTDNDMQGNKVLENEYEEKTGKLKKVGYMKKYEDMGYEVHRDAPNAKDFNADLKALCEMQKQQTEVEQAGMEDGIELE